MRDRSVEPLRVGVLGARGRMGVEVCRSVAGRAATTVAVRAMIRPARSENMWPASASNAREPVNQAPTISTTSTTATSPITIERRERLLVEADA